MFEHDQVGRELIEVAAVAAAAHVGLDARWNKASSCSRSASVSGSDPEKSPDD